MSALLNALLLASAAMPIDSRSLRVKERAPLGKRARVAGWGQSAAYSMAGSSASSERTTSIFWELSQRGILRTSLVSARHRSKSGEKEEKAGPEVRARTLPACECTCGGRGRAGWYVWARGWARVGRLGDALFGVVREQTLVAHLRRRQQGERHGSSRRAAGESYQRDGDLLEHRLARRWVLEVEHLAVVCGAAKAASAGVPVQEGAPATHGCRSRAGC